MQALGAGGILLLLLTGNLRAPDVVGFCLALSNAFGLLAGGVLEGVFNLQKTLAWKLGFLSRVSGMGYLAWVCGWLMFPGFLDTYVGARIFGLGPLAGGCCWFCSGLHAMPCKYARTARQIRF